jgi:hypothetical protein
MIGMGGASPITDTAYMSKSLSGTGRYTWQRDTHHNFGGPNGVAIAGNLSIPAWLASDPNTSIFYSGNASGGLNKGSGWPSLDGWIDVGIEDVLINWNSGDPLKMSPANENMINSKLLSSILILNVGASRAPTAEPAKLLILGLGLIGVSIWGRKKFTSKIHRV